MIIKFKMNFLLTLLLILPNPFESTVTMKAERLGMFEINGSFYMRIQRKPTGPWQWTFAYSPDQICTIRRHLNLGMFFQLLNVFTLEQSASIELLSDHSITQLQHIEPMACFRHDSTTYVLTKHHTTNYTTIQRGMDIKTIAGLNYDRILFDNSKERLYMLKHHLLREINISRIEQLWQWPHLRPKQIEMLTSNHILTLNETASENLMIIDGWLLQQNNLHLFPYKKTKSQITISISLWHLLIPLFAIMAVVLVTLIR